MCLGTVHYHLEGEKKIKTWKRLPDSFARVLPAQDSRQLYISSIIWDHMWKFWSLTFLFLSLRPKRLVSHPNCLIKEARVASKACRQNGDKWEGGSTWRFGKGTELVQVPSTSPLWLSWGLPVSFTKAPSLSLPKTFRTLWLWQSVYPLPEGSSGHHPLSTEIWTASCWKTLLLLLPK